MTKRTEVTREQIGEIMRDHPEVREDMTRITMLLDLAGEHEEYTSKLTWLAETLAEEVRRNEDHGIASVHESVLATSLIPDIRTHAAKISILARSLKQTCKADDDPKATALDALIRSLDPRNQS